MKKIILTTLFMILLTTVKSQVFYQNNLIEIKGYVNIIDSNIVLVIKNVSEFTFLFNEKEVDFIKVRDNYVVDLSLENSGVSLIEPSPGEFMYFRRLLPNSSYSILIEKEMEDWSKLSEINLLTRIQYLVIPENVVLLDGVLNSEFIATLKKEKYPLYTFKETLNVVDLKNSDCIKYLKIKGQ